MLFNYLVLTSILLSKNSYEKYILFSKNYPCKFIIDNSGGRASNWNIEEKTKKTTKFLLELIKMKKT